MTAALATPCQSVLTADQTYPPSLHPRATLAATILGSSVAFIDGSVINVALPALSGDLGAGPAELTWTINAYLLPLGALTLFGGALGDHFGRRLLFLLGLAVFTAGSIVCALAPGLVWLLAGRGGQGLGAALLLPNSLALLGAGFTGQARGRAIGTWAAVGALGGALGPLVGGWLVDTAGWRSIFLLNLPIAAAAAALAFRYVGESRAARSTALDWAGGALATFALLLLTMALTFAAALEPSSTAITAMTAGGVATLGVFLWLERRRGERAIMPLALFATRPFIGLSLLTFFLYGALGGLVVLLPFLLIEAGGYSAVSAGAAMLPLPIAIGLGSPFMGWIAARTGARFLLGCGCSLAAAGFALFLRIGPGDIDFLTHVFPAVALIALGMTICVAPLTTSVMAAVDIDHVGAASGFNSAVARIGGLLATGALGFVFALQGSSEAFHTGFRVAAGGGAILAAMAAGCSLLLVSRKAERAAGSL